MQETITVYNEEGVEQEFYVLEQTQLQGVSYLLAVEDIEDEELEAWIFKQVGTDGDDVCYETIDDETELNAISSIFEELLEDYDFE